MNTRKILLAVLVTALSLPAVPASASGVSTSQAAAQFREDVIHLMAPANKFASQLNKWTNAHQNGGNYAGTGYFIDPAVKAFVAFGTALHKQHWPGGETSDDMQLLEGSNMSLREDIASFKGVDFTSIGEWTMELQTDFTNWDNAGKAVNSDLNAGVGSAFGG